MVGGLNPRQPRGEPRDPAIQVMPLAVLLKRGMAGIGQPGIALKIDGHYEIPLLMSRSLAKADA
ncbi:hypothetical protein [Stenotrophomonas rhizophila]|uniref:hypothetical protein n=1 Tax=Stenotrophomonas rhizophila TaxID=216778 RepID=UPI00163A5A8A|nr:hypothetical protein [Stenotrophomonas rhizophila]